MPESVVSVTLSLPPPLLIVVTVELLVSLMSKMLPIVPRETFNASTVP